MSPVQLCDLPLEVLDHILDYTIPVHRLSGHRPTDPEWSCEVDGTGKQLPSLIVVNRQLSKQATNVFYSKAILEVAPIKPPLFVLNGLGSGLSTNDLDLTWGVGAFHPNCPATNLQCIKTVHMYTGQSDAVTAEGYEATLRLLIRSTSVKNIHLSRMVMNRLRKARINVSAALHNLSGQEPELVRTVYVWTKHPRSFWERTRRKEMSRISGVLPPSVQVYVYQQGEKIDPVLDPRWDVRSSDDKDFRTMLQPLVNFLDNTAARDPVFTSATRAEKLSGSDHLYQMVLVVHKQGQVNHENDFRKRTM